MDFDQNLAGPVDWNFPSPNTPHTGGPDVLQTPKTSLHPSHFRDAFATPQMASYTPYQTQYAPVPQPSPAQWMPSSIQTQTPPPTRDSVKVQQIVAFGTPSTIATKSYMTPQQGYPVQMQQPLFNAPATAPVKASFQWDATAMDPFMVPAWSQPTLQEQVSQTVQQSLQSSVDPSLVYSSPVPVAERRPLPRRVSARQPRLEPERPALRRSNTTGSSRASLVDVPRSASPLKRTRLRPVSESQKLRQRSSVVLTIDENGLARTETQDSPTRSMRARYPALFDSDSESDEEQEPQKAARLESPIENLEGLSIPRSGSSASMRIVTPSRAAVAAAAQLRRQGSLRRTSSLRRAPIDTCPMDAKAEQMMTAREHTMTTRRRQLDAHNRRWSLMSEDPFRAVAPVVIGRKMRCVCGVADDQDAVQCVSCTQWSHTACVGIRNGFTCILCTRPT